MFQMWLWLHMEMKATYARILLQFVLALPRICWLPMAASAVAFAIAVYKEATPEKQECFIPCHEGSLIMYNVTWKLVRENSMEIIEYALKEGTKGTSHWKCLIELNLPSDEQNEPWIQEECPVPPFPLPLEVLILSAPTTPALTWSTPTMLRR